MGQKCSTLGQHETRKNPDKSGPHIITACHAENETGAWRRGWDSNPRDALTPAGFQDRCLQPLGHPSGAAVKQARCLALYDAALKPFFIEEPLNNSVRSRCELEMAEFQKPQSKRCGLHGAMRRRRSSAISTASLWDATLFRPGRHARGMLPA